MMNRGLVVGLSILSTNIFAVNRASFAQGVVSDRVIVVNLVGCNASSLVQLPDTTDLFLDRQLITVDGQIAGVTGPNDCSGGNPDNTKHGKAFNQWTLTLVKFDWTTHVFTLVKPIIDTSVDPARKSSRALITAGPQRGAFIRSAYDPDVVRFHGKYWVVYECTLEEGIRYGVPGTSICLSLYDLDRQELDLSHTQVLVSGVRISPSRFISAAVPALLSYHDKLFVYWSVVTSDDGKFTGIATRDAELEVAGDEVQIKNAKGHLVYATDEPQSTEVWSVDARDSLSNNTADLRGVWATQDSLVAAASIGGSGCTTPSDHQAGCYRLSLVKAAAPLGRGEFSSGRKVPEALLPSNAQEYTRPIRDPAGSYWLIGHYIRPSINGFSETRPLPNAVFWKNYQADSVVIMYPLLDRSLWPAE